MGHPCVNIVVPSNTAQFDTTLIRKHFYSPGISVSYVSLAAHYERALLLIIGPRADRFLN